MSCGLWLRRASSRGLPYLTTTISRFGQGRRPLAGLNAVGTLPWSGPAHVLTAWNPSSIVRPESSNRAANKELDALLRQRGLAPEWVIGRSDDRTWSEESLLIQGLGTEEAVELGRRFGQLAVFELEADELRVVRTSDGEVVGRTARRR